MAIPSQLNQSSSIQSAPSRRTPIPPAAMPLIHPSTLLQAHLRNSPSIRVSGRQPSQYRPASINIGSLTHCNGSCVVNIGETTIICGVRGEILPISEVPSYNASASAREVASNYSTKDGSSEEKNRNQKQNRSRSRSRRNGFDPVALYSLVVPNIDLSTGCSPGHAMNTAPSASTQALTQRLYRLLLSTNLVSAEDLEIMYTPPPDTNYELDPDDPAYVADAGVEQVKAFWVLYVDMVCISYGGEGVVFDAAWLAMYAALCDTLLPRAWWDGDQGMVLCDADVNQGRKLDVRHVSMPVPLSFGVFETNSTSTSTSGEDDKDHPQQRQWTLVDLDAFEEECCHERGCVVIDALTKNKIVRIEKTGGIGTETGVGAGSGIGTGALDHTGLQEILELTQQRGREWNHILDEALKRARI